jgi:hypothetical protein
MSTPAERAHLTQVADLGCILCRTLQLGPTPAERHHLREEQGLGQRASHFLTVPLCMEHHRGRIGFHGLGRRAFCHRYKLDELDLLALTLEALATRER